MFKMSLQVLILVIVPMATLIWFLNSGSTTTLVYGSGSAQRHIQLNAKRNGDTEIYLNESLLFSKNFIDLEFGKREVFETDSLDYQLDCVKEKLTPKLQELRCLFDTKRGEVLLFSVKREGFVRVQVSIESA